MRKALQQTCDDRTASTTDAAKERKIAHLYQKILGSQGKGSPRRALQKNILPQWQTALK